MTHQNINRENVVTPVVVENSLKSAMQLTEDEFRGQRK